MTQEQKITKLIDLVNLTPNIQWDYDNLSANPNIYLENITINNGDIKPFNKENLSYNPNLIFDWLYNNFLFNYDEEEPKSWDWEPLTENIPLLDILSHFELPWNSRELSDRITDLHFVFTHLDFDWNWESLDKKFSVDEFLAEYKQHPDIYFFDFEDFSNNKSLTVKFILEHEETDWNYRIISKNIDLSEIQNNPNFEWKWEDVSDNKSLTSEFILSHLDEKWNWEKIFQNPNIDYDILADSKIDLSRELKNSFEKDLYYPIVAKNVTSKFIKKYKDIFLQRKDVEIFDAIHRNGRLTLEDIKEDPDLIVSYQYFSENPNLTIEYLIANKDEKWNFSLLSRNKAFKMKDIIKGIINGIKWDYTGLSKNPNVTFDFIYATRYENWSGIDLSQNPFVEQRKINMKEYGLNDVLLNDINEIVLEY